MNGMGREAQKSQAFYRKYTANVKSRGSHYGEPPNGLAFSCRERARYGLQKPYDLAREAVSCNAGLDGGSGSLVSIIVATL
jgi:hypothetical protein